MNVRMHRRCFNLAIIMLASLASVSAAWSQNLGTAAREVWVAIRSDGKPGSGAATDPFDGGSVQKLDALVEKFQREYGDNLTIHFGPGVFYGDRRWAPKDNWKIRGAGMDITVFKTRPDPEAIETVGFSAGGYMGGPSGFELSDCSFDFNTPNLHKANRAFVFPFEDRWAVCYFFAKQLPAWSPQQQYRHGDAVAHKGTEFIALDASKGKEPAQGPLWSVLRPNQAGKLAAWQKGRSYNLGEAVRQKDVAYLCAAAGTTSDPAADRDRWRALNPRAIDPAIYTCAAFVSAQPPGGRHHVSRVKAINGNGSFFFGREDFIIGLGGNDCVIEDCIVEQFQGDYSTLIVVNFGQHGVVRHCTVRGNDELGTMAYGGWACWDAVFEDNFCTNCAIASNIDSLNCRNVTFRNNVFMNCRNIGILVNMGGKPCEGHEQFSMIIDGKPVRDFARSVMDGLFVYHNLVELRDGAIYGAVQAQCEGLRNVSIHDNVMRTTSGHGHARAVGILQAKEVTVHDNLCEPGMYSETFPQAVTWRNNRDLLGQPMKDSQGHPVTAAPAASPPPPK